MEKRKILALGLALVAGLVFLAPTMAAAQGANANGWVEQWLILGQYRNGYNDSPPAAAARYDWLTDGSTRFERTYAPAAGDVLNTKFFTTGVANTSASNAFVANAPLNGFAVPTVFALTLAGTSIADYSTIFGADTNGVMCYAWTYANNTTGAPLNCFVGVGSDDSIQVLVNGEEVGINIAGRGWGGENNVQNAYPCTLKAGWNLICTKVFEGGGGFGFNLRLQTDEVTGDISAADNVQAGVSFTNVKPAGYVPPTDVAEAYRTVGSNAYDIGVPINVRINVERMAGSPDATVTETVPTGWTISNVVASQGTAAAAANVITWPVGTMIEPQVLTYTVTPSAGSVGAQTFTGTIAYGTTSRKILADITLAPPAALPAKVNLLFPAGNWGDIGTASSIPGSLAFDPATLSYTLTGSGDDVWNAADGMFAAWQQVSGDFYMEAIVSWVDTSDNNWCKAGLMVRQSMDPASQHAWVGIRRPDNVAGREVCFQWRDAAAGGSNWTGDAPGVSPIALRVLRQGNQVFGYYNDGTNWQQCPGSPHTVTGGFTDPVFAVIWTTAHTTADSATARFTPILGDPEIRTAIRDLPTTYGTAAVPVTITIDRKSAGSALTVTEVIPAGWTASATGATVNGTTITWTGSTADSLSYTATPGGAADKWPRFFSGRIKDGSGNTIQITGDSAIGPSGRAIFIDGALPDSSYTGVEDTYLIVYGITRDGTPPMDVMVSVRNQGRLDHLEEGSFDGGDLTPPAPMSDHKKILIKFNTDALPANANVSEATLRMWYDYQRRGDISTTQPSRFDHFAYAHMLNKPFGEGTGNAIDGPWSLRGEANWLYAQHMQLPWQVPGVLGAADLNSPATFVAPSTAQYGVQTGVWVEWNLTEFVKEWVRRPRSNFGIKISQDELGTSTSGYRTGAYNFFSSDYGNPAFRPTLSVAFSESPIVLSAKHWTLY